MSTCPHCGEVIDTSMTIAEWEQSQRRSLAAEVEIDAPYIPPPKGLPVEVTIVSTRSSAGSAWGTTETK